jgi:two-component system, sensor histidine kinase and response regulator
MTMKKLRWIQFWAEWGLIPRLMFAVGLAIVTGGGVQTYLLVAEGAIEHSARLRRDMEEALSFLAPLVADQAILGEYEAINQLLKNQVKRGELDRFQWTDKSGRQIIAQDLPDKSDAPAWFVALANIQHVEGDYQVEAGGVGYGTLHAIMTAVKARNRLWGQFVKQLQIVVVTLFLMLQFIWLIFRGNLGTLRGLAEGANRFSQGDHAVRIESEGAPEVRLAADAFNNMADNIEHLLTSLGQSESKNRLLATIVEQSSEAIWTNDLGGTITSWNSGAVAMFGYSSGEAVGRKLIGGTSAPDGEEESRMARLLRLEKFTYEVKARTKSDGELDIRVAVAPLVDGNNKCIGTISVAHDITERNRIEEELRVAREAAESASLAKSSFLARMSHEIRTPMNGVLGMTELLLETELTGTQRKYAETVQRSGKNLLGIINDILDFSKIEAGKLELEHIDMDLRSTVEDVVELLAERAQDKGVELACNISPDLTNGIKGDPLRLGQILTNLVGNAIKFTDSGQIVISVTALEETAENLTLRFEVSDSGSGIEPEALSRIFDNFSQADGSTTRKHGGTGLGLAISTQLVEMMGGKIHVESTPGVGSTFWFSCRFDKQETQTRESSLPQGALGGMRALVVGPSTAMSGSIIQSQLISWDMSHRSVETPQQALEVLAQGAAQGAPYDVAVLDLGPPNTGAFELARTIRADAAVAKVRLVMLTTVDRHADIREARNAGIDACLVKPLRQAALYRCLMNVMAGPSEATVSPEVADVPTDAAPPRIRGNLLLAEDNPINQMLGLRILEIEGYRVTAVNNGKEALDAFAQGSFDLILMDCQMPEMDGYEATEKIREKERQSNAKRIPIIALTANAMNQDREKCLNAGMDDYLSKPYGRLQIRDILNHWVPQTAPAPARAGDVAGAAPAAVAEVLDRKALDAIRALEENLLENLINRYLLESPKLVQRLKQAAAANDLPEVGRAAHVLLSSSASLGAMGLTRLCRDLETSTRAAAAEARKLLAQLEAEYGRVQIALTAELVVKAA